VRSVVAALATGSLLLSGCTMTSDRLPLPDLVLPEFDGDRTVELRSLEGPMLVNLWASWCTSCRQEMPLLEEFHQLHGDEVAVVGIDFQETDLGNAKALVDETGVTYELLLDELGDLNGADPLPNVQGLPVQLYVDEDGEVAYIAYQAFESLDEIEASVNEHLGTDL
jgi:cytochrome c biogenesis protein CcmG/thiol:disulfide interchange protein DsbE